MSEPKLISPMLDGFTMGDPISNRHGVCCCPAMPDASNDRYIVKIISIPASQVQLQALLLTGAYPSEDAARNYFRELAQNVVGETEILQKLSKMEGFLPFESCQVVPMENEVGYDVYLLSSYKRSLARLFRKETMTHLGAVNLGLDLCASLAVCRQAGYLYADLRPENVFICGDKEYRIGDIGFLKLDGLKYASLPERYISNYSAPEIVDAFSDVNPTIDIYAAGLILYQAYNGGVLPFTDRTELSALPPPAYADYEMAEIILKACAPDPKDRFSDPIAMGQAIIAYMQRNGANDTPIVTQVEEHPEVGFAPEPEDIEEDEAVIEIADDFSISTEDQICLDEFYALTLEAGNLSRENTTEFSALFDGDETEDSPEEESFDDEWNLSFLDEMISDDTAPSEDLAEAVAYDELSGDANDILSQADQLLAHETPVAVAAPEAIDVPVTTLTDDKEDDGEASTPAEDAAEEDAPQAREEQPAEEKPDADTTEALAPSNEEETAPAKKNGKANKVLTTIMVILLIGCLLCGAYLFYTGYYLRTVTKLELSGTEDQLFVHVDANVDDAHLTVICTDTHGTSFTSSVTDGTAVFDGLNPNMLYTVRVEVSGVRKLTGEISGNYTTPLQTNIATFTAIAGEEAGTAVLNFTVDGMDADQWILSYAAEGEEEKQITFSGHMVNVTGLTTDKTYTFRLDAASNLYIVGNDTLEYTARKPVFAENLAVIGCDAESLTVDWSAPEGADVSAWTVRCYSENGFDQTITVTDTMAKFTGITGSDAHTIEVTADGMSTAVRCYMSANAVTVTEISAQSVDAMNLLVSWSYAGNKPTGKWLVMYTIDGIEGQNILQCENNSAVIRPFVPGNRYTIHVQLDDGTTVFSQPVTITTGEASDFSGYSLRARDITVSMCNTPQKENWDRHDLAKDDYTNSFKVGTKASFLLKAMRTYGRSDDLISTMFVIRDAQGKLISFDTVSQIWTDMWLRSYCELNIPALPQIPGEYTVDILFNGKHLHKQAFTVTE